MDRATANLPSRSFDDSLAFYQRLGFSSVFKDAGWMILERGGLVLEFFPYPDLDPRQSSFSACFRVDDLDGLYAAFGKAGLSGSCWDIPRLTPLEVEAHGLRMFALVDLDGNLIRCIDNHYQH